MNKSILLSPSLGFGKDELTFIIVCILHPLILGLDA